MKDFYTIVISITIKFYSLVIIYGRKCSINKMVREYSRTKKYIGKWLVEMRFLFFVKDIMFFITSSEKYQIPIKNQDLLNSIYILNDYKH